MKKIILLLVCILALQGAAMDSPEYVFDSQGRVILIDYADDGFDVAYTYWDSTGDLIKTEDFGHGTKVVGYDRERDIISVKYGGEPSLDTTFSYYPDGSVKSVNRGGTMTEYEYTFYGLVSSEKTTVAGVETTTAYIYDDNGRVAFVYTGDSVVEYKYDGAGRLASEAWTYNMGGNVSEERLDYTYDANSNLIKVESSVEGTTEYAYAEIAGMTRLKSVSTDGRRVDVVYDGSGEITSYCEGSDCLALDKEYEGGLLASDSRFDYFYDSEGRLVRQASKDPGTPLEIRYTYYANGLLKEAAVTNGVTSKYYYDALDRVVKITRSKDGESYDIFPVTPMEFDETMAKSEFGSVAVYSGASGATGGVAAASAREPAQPNYPLYAAIAAIGLIGAFFLYRKSGR